MGEGSNSGANNKVPEVYRIRRSEAIGLVTLPFAIAALGLMWNYTHSVQVDTDRKIERVREECSQRLESAKSDLRRELDQCCKRRR